MTRVATLLVLSAAGLLLTPGVAPAQFGMPFGAQLRFSGPTGMPVFVPSTNPFFYVPKYRYTSGWRYTGPTLFGNTTIGYQNTYFGLTHPTVMLYMANNPYTYSRSSSYMSGGANARPDLVQAAQRDLERAQRAAALPQARSEIAGQWNYEKGDAGAPGPLPLPPPIRVAIAPTDRGQITSGEALNTILREVIRLEATGASGPSAYVSPLLLEDIRFGSPAGDLLNLVREAGGLSFPSAFDAPSLATLRTELERDFAAVAAVVQDGKSPEAGKLAKLEQTYQRLRDASGPVIGHLPFDEATAAKRFLNRMGAAVKALKAGAGSGLIDPKWAAEGLTISELVKHMNKHKLLFGPAPRGGEEAYSTTHQNLATYLFVLNQPKK